MTHSLAHNRQDLVLPFHAKDGAKTASVKLLEKPDLRPVQNPGLCTIQEGGNNNGSVYLDLCREVEQMALPHSL